VLIFQSEYVGNKDKKKDNCIHKCAHMQEAQLLGILILDLVFVKCAHMHAYQLAATDHRSRVTKLPGNMVQIPYVAQLKSWIA
jgi:hypothetical protein